VNIAVITCLDEKERIRVMIGEKTDTQQKGYQKKNYSLDFLSNRLFITGLIFTGFRLGTQFEKFLS
jgi:small basic protein